MCVQIALDLARALVYLHSKRLVHLDVKSSNVLLSRCAGQRCLVGLQGEQAGVGGPVCLAG